MITTKAIDHICLWVSSLETSKYYYETLFGVTCMPRDNDPSTLVVESEFVHFFITEDTEGSDFLSKQHLSFEVDSLDEVITSLKDFGINDYQTGTINFFSKRNYKWCEWRDPDGIRIECVEII